MILQQQDCEHAAGSVSAVENPVEHPGCEDLLPLFIGQARICFDLAPDTSEDVIDEYRLTVDCAYDTGTRQRADTNLVIGHRHNPASSRISLFD